MCSKCCCNSDNKKGYICGIIFLSVVVLVFQIYIVALFANSINPDEIQSYVLSETPLYNFELNPTEKYGKKNITFFEFKGRERKVGNRTETYDVKSFTKIYQNKFLYEGKEKNYFDYKNKYSVPSGDNCPTNHKQCGILDSNERILCLPIDEDCPLNDFAISQTINDPTYEGYLSKEVTDSISYDTYYIYYTNTKITNKIITEFKLSYGPPCALISEKNWISVYTNEIEKDDYNCKTYINGNNINTRYDKVSGDGINIQSLYKDNGLKDTFTTNAIIDIYIRNYNDIDEQCFQGFFDDLTNEEKYYIKITTVIRSLGSISIIITIANLIFCILMSCYNFSFKSFIIIVPLYGIIANIIILGIINKSRIRYKCQLEGFNEYIDELLDSQYDNSVITFTVMSSISLVVYGFILMFTLCLKFMKGRLPRMNGTTVVLAPGSTPPVYPIPYPYTVNIPYKNVMPGSSSYPVPV